MVCAADPTKMQASIGTFGLNFLYNLLFGCIGACWSLPTVSHSSDSPGLSTQQCSLSFVQHMYLFGKASAYFQNISGNL